MKKRVVVSMLVFSLLFVLPPARAEAATKTPSLTFSGGTAKCKVIIVEAGKSTNATMELWYGTTRLDSWSGSGSSYLTLTGNHGGCISGRTYTLKVYGTIGGTAFPQIEILAVC